ncbi:hypothetical protein NQ314_002977 [Rhamnusium bicolor]|uniref:adenylate cyclase n=1 Tax=Rhamnusium bicolor TaxID=1586634 RepID=A0AAV8ZQG2_9CUCU|nr:hypothetical protein NQ314_002977 [Rhamnusium bicolor]
MENEDNICDNVNKNDLSCTDDIKTPTSTASSGKYSVKLKNWKMPKFMRKTSDQRQDLEVDVFTVSDSFISITKPEEEELIKETIDIKSYISQSRSDIGQYDYSPNNEFIRSGSYRSQYGRSPVGDLPYLQRAGSNRSRRGRSPNFDGLEPTERARSATITATNLQRPKKSLEVPSRLPSIAMLEDYSNYSRKDSGIKSNSRRSSIQQIDNALLNSEILQHRVSGYYTSSQSSINSPQVPRIAGPFFDKFGTCIQNLRKQSDRQLIKCVQDNSKSRSSYFIKPPLSKVTLFFKDKDMEKQYRMNVHYIDKKDVHAIPTLANSSFNTYLDVFVSTLVFLLVSIGEALVYGVTSFVVIFLENPCSFPEKSINGSREEMLPSNLLTISDDFYNYNSTENIKDYKSCYFFKAEVLMNLFLLVILVWTLTREFEIGYRLGFHANFVANKDKNKVQSLKNQADYLIYNIVPEHVAEQLKKDAKYSENFKAVGIIFASIVNFNEMYDESYEGGREYLRVLNELIGDFDELLDRPEFYSVEKIKTIGSTFMAASGLNSHMRQQQRDPHEHLYALMDFAMEMQRVVNDFNRDLLEFNLILRIGYNFGDVTAAVIGNTKLYYDIWGDAVNISSRMDSTGVSGRIQVGRKLLSSFRKQV